VFLLYDRCRRQKGIEADGRRQTVVTLTVEIPSTVRPSSPTSPSGKNLEARVVSTVRDEQNVPEVRTERSLTAVGSDSNSSKDEPSAIDRDGVKSDLKEMTIGHNRNFEIDEADAQPITQSAVVLDSSCLHKPLQIDITAVGVTSEQTSKINSKGISPAVTITFSTVDSLGGGAASPTDNGIAGSSSTVSVNGTSDSSDKVDGDRCNDQTCNSSATERLLLVHCWHFVLRYSVALIYLFISETMTIVIKYEQKAFYYSRGPTECSVGLILPLKQLLISF
jgi:hypothetical protein